ncbi:MULTISPECIES: AraC family transcriptional regulator [Paenibacillus]|uniref:AraC family transcriptional regulator n=1 Tax=Paenibacillus TaxID=44249 RepID=UPI0022B878C1|nr:AraC family transcriptional regulator [Paenibacillus caseinilyticus]MCZ8522291.1 AraC family transcriptional regulator [Paenibacillus caseinilyticus]
MSSAKRTYTPAPAAHPGMELKLYYCGAEDCTPGHSWGPGLKDHYKIHFVRSGRGIFRSQGRTHTVSAGQGFLIRPQEVAYYEADVREPWSYAWAAFNGLQAEAFLNRAGLGDQAPVFGCTEEEAALLWACFEEMLAAGSRPASRDLRLMSSLYAMLGALVDRSQQPASADPAGGSTAVEGYVARAVAYIETNYSRSMTVEELAAELGLHRKYAAKLFKEALGVPPRQFLLQYRMEQAALLLSREGLSVAEVAHSVGYRDPLLFSRMFKKVKGLSPQRFRQA